MKTQPVHPRRLRRVPVALLLAALGCSEPPTIDHISESAVALPAERVAALEAATAYVKTGHGSGSAFRIGRLGEDALVVTNDHVVRPPGDTSLVRFAKLTFGGDDWARKARIIGSSPEDDLAFMVVPFRDGDASLALGSTDEVDSDTPLFTVGFPFGEVLAKGARQLTATFNPGLGVPRPFWRRGEPKVPLIAGVNPGNSGGPVVDRLGIVRGVVVAHHRGTELSYLVPTDRIRALVERIAPKASLEWTGTPAPEGASVVRPQAPAVVEATAAAAVLVETPAGRSGGFVFGRRSGHALVLTNRHGLFLPSGEPSANVKVLARGKGRLPARLLRSDAGEDLAILAVEGLDAAPLELAGSGHLYETASIWTLGFASTGAVDATPTLRRGTISALRVAPGSELALLQIDVGIDDGNTGGPVLDEQGRTVGIAVASHPSTNVSTVVPTLRLRDLLRGQLRGGALALRHDGGERCALAFYAEVDDPLGNLETVGLNLVAQDANGFVAPGRREVSELGYALGRAGLRDGAARLSGFYEPCHPGTLRFQVWTEASGGERQFSLPQKIEVVDGEPVEITFRGTYQPGDAPIRSDPFSDGHRALPPGWSRSCKVDDLKACESRCEVGEWRSCVVLGDAALDAEPSDPERARALYRRACEKEEIAGCDRLAGCFPGDDAIPPRSRLLELHQAGCVRGQLPGCHVAAMELWREPDGVGAPRAVEHFSKLCEGGEPRSCAMLGVAQVRNRGLRGAPDRSFASALFQQACSAKVPAACHDLAWIKGGGFAAEGREVSQAARILEDTCALGRGWPPSCNDWAVLLARGTLGSANRPFADALLKRACERGFGLACDNQRAGDPAGMAMAGGALEPPVEALDDEPFGCSPGRAIVGERIPDLERWARVGAVRAGIEVRGGISAVDGRDGWGRIARKVGECLLTELGRDAGWRSARKRTAVLRASFPVLHHALRAPRFLEDTTGVESAGQCLLKLGRGAYVPGENGRVGDLIVHLEIER